MSRPVCALARFPIYFGPFSLRFGPDVAPIAPADSALDIRRCDLRAAILRAPGRGVLPKIFRA